MNTPANSTAAMDPLANLRGLHSPEYIHWWPPAPGWWLLAALSLITIGFVSWKLFCHWRNNRYRKVSLNTLAHIESSFQVNKDTKKLVAQTSALLKITAKHCYGAQSVNALNGENWSAFLQRHGNNNAIFNLLAQEHYSKDSNCNEHEALQLLKASKDWIRSHKKPANGVQVSC